MKHNKILLTSVLGNTLEYYEFSIFAVFAVQIGQCFFPNQSSSAQIVLTLTLFASGFLSRPFGSVIFGHIGDKFGRQKSLMITILGMALVTFSIGFMPSFKQIGMLAPWTLFFLRLLQGIFIGGEGAGSAVYILEHELRFKKSVIGGILISSNVAGTFLASLVGIIISKLVGLNDYSWRYAFFVGGIAGLVISYLRINLPESEQFDSIDSEHKPNIPIIKLFTKYWRQVLLVISFGGFSSSVSYMIKGYINIFFQEVLKIPAELSFKYLMFSSVLFAGLPPFIGYFFCNNDNSRFIKIISFFIAIAYLPSFLLMSSTNTALFLTGLVIATTLAALICTPIYTYFMTIFPAEVRFSGVAISFNIGITFIGGSTPLIATFLIKDSGLVYAPAIYITILSVIYIALDFFLNHKIDKANKRLAAA
jgi:MHS family proline/betaine transporter-like MFS transporter